MAADDPRVELLELVRSTRAALEWLKDSGVDELPGSLAAIESAARAHAAAMPKATAMPKAAATPQAAAAGADARSPRATRADEGLSHREAPDLTQPRPTRADEALSHREAPDLTGSRAAAPTPRAELERPVPTPALPLAERQTRLVTIAAEVAACTRCALSGTRTNTAFARGTPGAELMFVGEGPGAQEDREGAPFVGPAGQLLDKMIAAMGFAPEEIYIANLVKCRAHEDGRDRKPGPDELAACMPYLEQQIELCAPKVIVALGATAVQALTGLGAGITKLRGTWRLYRGTIPLMPTFHPAYLLRAPEMKRVAWDDLKQVMSHLKRPSGGSRGS